MKHSELFPKLRSSFLVRPRLRTPLSAMVRLLFCLLVLLAEEERLHEANTRRENGPDEGRIVPD